VTGDVIQINLRPSVLAALNQPSNSVRSRLAENLVRNIYQYRSAEYYHLTWNRIARDQGLQAIYAASQLPLPIVQRLAHRAWFSLAPTDYLDRIQRSVKQQMPEIAQQAGLAQADSVFNRAWLKLQSDHTTSGQETFAWQVLDWVGSIAEPEQRSIELLYFSAILEQAKVIPSQSVAQWTGETRRIGAVSGNLLVMPNAALRRELAGRRFLDLIKPLPFSPLERFKSRWFHRPLRTVPDRSA
jgi:hypothetical protein